MYVSDSRREDTGPLAADSTATEHEMAMSEKIGKYLWAIEVAAPNRVTKVFDICCDENDRAGNRLGVISRFGRWRQYAFYPDANMVFEKQCLRDLASFCERLMAERKAEREAERETP